MQIGLRQGVSAFFDILGMYEDIAHGYSFKSFIHQSILRFLDDENKNTAFQVYLNFFDAYKISMGFVTVCK